MGKDHKRKTNRRTLGIDPGTRELGYAVLDDGNLIFFGVHTFRHRRLIRVLDRENERVIGKLVEGWRPDLVVIGEASRARTTRAPRLSGLIGRIKLDLRRRRIRVKGYPLPMVKEVVAGDRRATKRDVAEAIVKEYPYLEKHLVADRRSGEKYWENVFEAAALALTGFRIEEQNSSRSV